MKTIRRLLFRDIVTSVNFVALAFLSLFFFIDFVDHLGDARAGQGALQAALYSLLEVPAHFYELSPIAVLIGSIYTLSRLAQSSEFTILRTGGLGPGRALSLLASLGLVFAIGTWIVGDYIAPRAEQEATHLQAIMRGGMGLPRTGAWLKDRVNTPQGERQFSISIGGAAARGVLRDIRIFEFDDENRLVQRIHAGEGAVGADSNWVLSDVTVTRWIEPKAATPEEAKSKAADPRVGEQHLNSMDWQSTLSAGVVAAAVLPLETMSTLELREYIAHLALNEQAAQQYEIQFWKRALYPFACVVMVALALPFAYLQARGGGISLKVFGGIMLGISFVLLNNVAGHLGMLKNWTPWIVSSTPSLIYLLLSLGAFAWLVRYR